MTARLPWITNRIFPDLPALLHKANIWRGAGKKIVFTNGCFDILHRGHLDYLARAAALGNVLVVGVNTDASVRRLKGEQRPLNGEEDRLFALASLLLVEGVILFEEDTPAALIDALQPDILAKGGDYSIDRIVGAEGVLARGGKVEVIPFVEGYSTTGLIEKIHRL